MTAWRQADTALALSKCVGRGTIAINKWCRVRTPIPRHAVFNARHAAVGEASGLKLQNEDGRWLLIPAVIPGIPTPEMPSAVLVKTRPAAGLISVMDMLGVGVEGPGEAKISMILMFYHPLSSLETFARGDLNTLCRDQKSQRDSRPVLAKFRPFAEFSRRYPQAESRSTRFAVITNISHDQIYLS